MKIVILYNIKDFVSLSEKIENSPINIMNFLNENYFSLIHKHITQNNGKISDVIADKQFAIWEIKKEDKIINSLIESTEQLLGTFKKQNENLINKFHVIISIATSEEDQISANKCMLLNEIGKRMNHNFVIDSISKRLSDIDLIEIEIPEEIKKKYELECFTTKL